MVNNKLVKNLKVRSHIRASPLSPSKPMLYLPFCLLLGEMFKFVRSFKKIVFVQLLVSKTTERPQITMFD